MTNNNKYENNNNDEFPMSLGVSEVSEQMNERSGAREQSKQCGASE